MTVTKVQRLYLSAAVAVCMMAAASPVPAVAQSPAQRGWPRTGLGAATGNLGGPLLADLDGDNRSEVLLARDDDKLYICRHDGTTFTAGAAWPLGLGFGCGTQAGVAVGNVDNDPEVEIVVVGGDSLSLNARVKVFETTGGLVQNFLLNSAASGKATPCLTDCYRYFGSTRHPAEEIVIRDGDGKVHILYWNGTGFTDLYSDNQFKTCTLETQMDHFGRHFVTPSVSAAWDASAGVTALVASSTDGSIYRWNIQSSPGAGANWQVTPLASLTDGTSSTRFCSATLADVDGSAGLEVVASSSRGQVHVWNNNSPGTPVPGWPQSTGMAILSSPGVADIDYAADGTKEIFVGCDDHMVWVWRANGQLMPGWPMETGGPVIGSVLAAEIDGVSGLEIVAGSSDGYLYVWDHTGTVLDGWPKRLNTQVYNSPAVGDIHRGGRMAIVAAGWNGRLFVFDMTAKSLDSAAGWLQFRGGPKRTGTD